MRQVVFIALLALVGFAFCQIAELKSGVYSDFNLENKQTAYFKLRVHEKRLAPIDISIAPMRCNGPINIFASFAEEQPTPQTAEFKSQNTKTMAQSVLNIPESAVKPKDGYLHIGIEFRSMLGKLSCTGQIVAILNHYQSMVRLTPGFATVSNFSTLLDVHHFYEFTVNETSSSKPGHIGVIATGLNRIHPYDDELQVYVSTKTSRPLPTNFQWQGLLVDDGSFATILHSDPEYVKDGRYWVGVNTQAAHRPVPYSLTVFHLGGDNAKEILLNDNQYQLGFAFNSEYTYFYAYCDATANSLTFKLTPKFGTAVMFLSTTTQRPTAQDYQMKGTTIEFPAQSESFVYIGVIPDAGSPPIAAFDIVVTRN